jgi:hypothetical protein
MRTNLPNMDAQPGVSESAESLIAYCRESSRIYPMPQFWDALWELLPNCRRVGGRWGQPPSLILARSLR